MYSLAIHRAVEKRIINLTLEFHPLLLNRNADNAPSMH